MTEPEYLREVVNEYFKVKIQSNTRKRYTVYARKVYFKLANELYEYYTQSEIAKAVNRDHATFIHSVKTFYTVYDEHLEGYNHLMEKHSWLFKKPKKRLSENKRLDALRIADYWRKKYFKLINTELRLVS